MNSIAPGWYRDPAEPTTQRYWDGEGWLGEPLPIDATPPPGPPPEPGPSQPPAATSPAPGAATSPAPQPPEREPTAPPGVPPVFPPGFPPGAPMPGPHPPGHPNNEHPNNQHPAGQRLPPGVLPLPPGALPPGAPPLAYAYFGVPAPRPHGYPIAHPALRLAARAIDIVALLLLNVAVNGWFAYRWWQEIRPFYTEYVRRFQAGEPLSDLVVPQQSQSLELVILIIGVALWFAYEVPMVANSGQTLGKRLVGIKVLRVEADGPVGFRRSIRRWNPMGFATFLWTCFFIGLLLQFLDCLFILFGPLHQAMHDRTAATVVVYSGAARGGGGGSGPGGRMVDDNEGGTG